jgi:hypothetical protein
VHTHSAHKAHKRDTLGRTNAAHSGAQTQHTHARRNRHTRTDTEHTTCPARHMHGTRHRFVQYPLPAAPLQVTHVITLHPLQAPCPTRTCMARRGTPLPHQSLTPREGERIRRPPNGAMAMVKGGTHSLGLFAAPRRRGLVLRARDARHLNAPKFQQLGGLDEDCAAPRWRRPGRRRRACARSAVRQPRSSTVQLPRFCFPVNPYIQADTAAAQQT